MSMAADASLADENDALSRLVGVRLTAIQFVMDYLIIGFDPKGGLTTLVWPEMVRDDHKTSFGDPGYRDELCSLIEKVVTGAFMDVDETIHIKMDNGVELQIPLRLRQGGGERAILTGPNHYLFDF